MGIWAWVMGVVGEDGRKVYREIRYMNVVKLKGRLFVNPMD
jgi:hypothetical protein